MPSLRRSTSSPALRSYASPYTGHSRRASRRVASTSSSSTSSSSCSETTTRRVLADIEWWRVTSNELEQQDELAPSVFPHPDAALQRVEERPVHAIERHTTPEPERVPASSPSTPQREELFTDIPQSSPPSRPTHPPRSISFAEYTYVEPAPMQLAFNLHDHADLFRLY